MEARAALDVEFLLQQSGWMQRVALALLDDPHAAEDVVQETWLRALKNPPHGAAEPRTLRKWLRIVTQRVALRRLESEARRRRREEEVAKSERDLDADATTERLRLQRSLAGHVLELREPMRTAVLLRYQEELSFDEVATRLGVSNDAARQRVSRGVSELRKRLDRQHSGDRQRWNNAYALLAVPPGFLQAATRTAGLSTSQLALGGLLLLVAGIWLAAAWVVEGVESRVEPTPAQPVVGSTASAVVTERVRVESPAARVDLSTVDRDRDLHGRVVDASGVPVAGAEVLALPPQDQTFRWFRATARNPVRRAVTNAAGEFVLPLPFDDAVDLRVERSGFATTCLPEQRPGERVTVSLATPATIRGVVTSPSGAPVRDVRVRLDRLHRGGVFRAVATGRTGPDGSFRFQPVGRGRHVLRLLASDGNYDQRVLEVEAAGPLRCDVKLRRTRTVRGLVRADGAPVPGARVVVARAYLAAREKGGASLSPAMLGADWWGQAAVRSDANGRFAVAAPIDIVPSVVFVAADGYARAQATVTAGELELELRRGASVRGRCVDVDRQPLAEVEVTAIAQAHDGSVVHGDVVRARSDANGGFELTGLREDLRYLVVLRSRDHGVAMRHLPKNGDLDDIIVRRPASVRGVLRSPTNAPLTGRYVFVSPVLDAAPAREGLLAGLPAMGLLRCRTDDLGRFHIVGLAAGAHRLRVAGSADDAGVRFDARAGEVCTQDLDVTALPVAGEVVDHVGRPVLQAGLVLYGDGVKQTAVSVAHGRFRFESVPIGSYRLRVAPNSIHTKHGNRMVHGVDLGGLRAGDEQLRIVLPKAAVTKAALVDAAGAPVRRRLVFARDAKKRMVTYERTDDDGRIVLRLPPGATVDLYLGPRAREPFAIAVAAGSVGLEFTVQ